MKLYLNGAARQVTGSNHIIRTEQYTFAVDCGLYQGTKDDDRNNRSDFSYDPAELDFMILTHAHIDHSGRIPLLVKRGFKGKIFCTRPTADLATVLMLDSAHINEEDVRIENEKRKKSGLETIPPLFTEEDVIEAIQYLYPVEYEKNTKATRHIDLTFHDAGHLLGSAICKVHVKEHHREETLVFSGDLGTGSNPLLNDPKNIEEGDYLIVESTYGNRLHNEISVRVEKLAQSILETLDTGGTVIIPAFSIGRTQEVLYELKTYFLSEQSPRAFESIPFYIDSPLAIKGTEISEKHYRYFSKDIIALFKKSKSPFRYGNIHYVSDHEDSVKLDFSIEPKVLISASGMCEGGRILRHLVRYLPDPKAKVIFIGYQAIDSNGRKIKEGASRINLFDEEVPINCTVESIEGFSGHGDQKDLLNWIDGFSDLKKIIIVHGEDESSECLAKLASEITDAEIFVPSEKDIIEL